MSVIKKNWVLVFSFMYLVSVDPMDRSLVTEFLNLSDEFDTGQEILTNRNHQILILCLGTANITSTERWWNCSFWILFRWIFCSTVVFGAFWTLYRNGNSVRWTVPLCRSFWTHAYFHISINVMIDISTFLTFPACFYIPIIFSNLNSNCSNSLDIEIKPFGLEFENSRCLFTKFASLIHFSRIWSKKIQNLNGHFYSF